jgi:hypothetical protein
MGYQKDLEIQREENARDHEDKCEVCGSPESECGCARELEKMDELIDGK